MSTEQHALADYILHYPSFSELLVYCLPLRVSVLLVRALCFCDLLHEVDVYCVVGGTVLNQTNFVLLVVVFRRFEDIKKEFIRRRLSLIEEQIPVRAILTSFLSIPINLNFSILVRLLLLPMVVLRILSTPTDF